MPRKKPSKAKQPATKAKPEILGATLGGKFVLVREGRRKAWKPRRELENEKEEAINGGRGDRD